MKDTRDDFKTYGEPCIGIRDMAKALGASMCVVRKYIQKGVLPHVVKGGKRWVKVSDFERFKEELYPNVKANEREAKELLKSSEDFLKDARGKMGRLMFHRSVMTDVRKIMYQLSLATEDERSREILRKYSDKHTFREIADEGNMTRERVKQLIREEIGKLPDLLGELNLLREENKLLRDENARYRCVIGDTLSDGVHNNTVSPIFSKTIGGIGLTTRSVNALRRNGIDTIGKLVQTPRLVLSRKPCVGRSVLADIESRLRYFGLSLDMSVSDMLFYGKC